MNNNWLVPGTYLFFAPPLDNIIYCTWNMLIHCPREIIILCPRDILFLVPCQNHT